jgi:LacI family transcriptional regulator
MSEPMGSVTLRTVAEAAGVSISTASRALAGRGDLTSVTRRTVLTAAGELGYRPSRRSHSRQSALDPRLIELVLGTFDDPWSSSVVAGIRTAAFASGYDLVLTLEREDVADDWPARVARRRPSGVILGVIKPTRAQLQELTDATIPVVLLDPMSDPRGELASVGSTDWQGGYDAGAHLAASGLTRFVFVAGVPRYRFGKAREEGFRAAIRDSCPDGTITRVDSDWMGAELTGGFAAAVRELGAPVGVFASNDNLALAVYRAAERLRLAIPHDVSVVGFNDERRVAVASPPMTSVRQPLAAMTRRAVQLVGELRSGRPQPYERVELRTELIVRRSTLPV